ncbi:MAG: condensation domain-containing protein [Xanthobacteraceae bacterium]|jgi:hypothetical protein
MAGSDPIDGDLPPTWTAEPAWAAESSAVSMSFVEKHPGVDRPSPGNPITPDGELTESADRRTRPARTAGAADQGTHGARELQRFPASVAQRRLLQLAQLTRHGPAFNLPICVRIHGPLSADTIERSLQFLVDRHEALRTTFADCDGGLVQIIAGNVPVSLARNQIRSAANDVPTGIVAGAIRDEAERRFDLVRGPLVRARLLVVRPDEHILVITLHRMVADVWSLEVLQHELWVAYEALLDGRQPALLPLAVQYADFAAWQAGWLRSDEASAALRFWERTLAGGLAVLDLPAGRSGPGRPVSRGAVETLVLPDYLTQALRKRCEADDTTVFVAMYACFSVLLAGYADQDDVLVVSPFANRQPETAPLVGPLAVPLALRLDVSGNPTLRQVLRRAAGVIADALAHGDLPIDVVLERLKVRSVHGRNPFLQFCFAYQTAVRAPPVRDVTIAPMPPIGVGTPFELQLTVIEHADGFGVELHFDPDRLDGSAIGQMLECFEQLLTALAGTPDHHLDEIARRRDGNAWSQAASRCAPSRAITSRS